MNLGYRQIVSADLYSFRFRINSRYFPDKNGTNGNGKLPKFGKNIQYFLDRLYTSRISLRMLINQHTLLFTDMVSQVNNSIALIRIQTVANLINFLPS